MGQVISFADGIWKLYDMDNPLKERAVNYTVYYMKPNYFVDMTLGVRTPLVETLSETHVELKSLVADDLEDVFFQMQGENWSRDGEARELIEAKGLAHTSMSVGDVVRDDTTGMHYVVRPIGFRKMIP